MDKAHAKLDKATACLDKEAIKIPALWKAEAGLARSKEMLEAAEKEVTRNDHKTRHTTRQEANERHTNKTRNTSQNATSANHAKP